MKKEETEEFDDIELDKPDFTFSCSTPLMEAVRKLDYKQQYKVCEAFFQMFIESFEWEDSEMCLRFHDDFEEINPKFLDCYLKDLHFVVNDLDNAIYEIDHHDPMTFFDIERRLAPIILEAKKPAKTKKK